MICEDFKNLSKAKNSVYNVLKVITYKEYFFSRRYKSEEEASEYFWIWKHTNSHITNNKRGVKYEL